MKTMKITNVAKLYALILLYEKPAHGYDLMRSVTEKLGRKASPGQMYPFLDALRKHGYVRSVRRGSRNVYSLTPSGRSFVKGVSDKIVETVLKTKLKRCSHCGCQVYSGAHPEKVGGKTMMFCCSHCAKSFREHH